MVDTPHGGGEFPPRSREARVVGVFVMLYGRSGGDFVVWRGSGSEVFRLCFAKDEQIGFYRETIVVPADDALLWSFAPHDADDDRTCRVTFDYEEASATREVSPSRQQFLSARGLDAPAGVTSGRVIAPYSGPELRIREVSVRAATTGRMTIRRPDGSVVLDFEHFASPGREPYYWRSLDPAFDIVVPPASHLDYEWRSSEPDVYDEPQIAFRAREPEVVKVPPKVKTRADEIYEELEVKTCELMGGSELAENARVFLRFTAELLEEREVALASLAQRIGEAASRKLDELAFGVLKGPPARERELAPKPPALESISRPSRDIDVDGALARYRALLKGR